MTSSRIVETECRGLLMELELVEPDLFFRYHRRSVDRFCTALEKQL